MPQHHELADPPIGGERARALLGVNPAQLNRIREAGLLGDTATLRRARTSGGHWRYDEGRVRSLASRPWLALPHSSLSVAVHLSALTLDPARREGRTHHGWNADPGLDGLSAAQREDAWAGWWVCRPDRFIGGALIGDLCGFVVEVARIQGYRTAADGRVRFLLGRPTRQMLKEFAGHRFRAAQGAMVQPLGLGDPTSPSPDRSDPAQQAPPRRGRSTSPTQSPSADLRQREGIR